MATGNNKSKTIYLRLEGGVQAYQLLLQEINKKEEKTGTIDLGVKNEKK